MTIRRYRFNGCRHVWRQDTSGAAKPRAKVSRRGLRWPLEGIVCQHLTVARVAEGMGVAWNTANGTVLAEGRRVLVSDQARFDDVAVIGVDEHVGRHIRRGDKHVIVIIDLTPGRDQTSTLTWASEVNSSLSCVLSLSESRPSPVRRVRRAR